MGAGSLAVCPLQGGHTPLQCSALETEKSEFFSLHLQDGGLVDKGESTFKIIDWEGSSEIIQSNPRLLGCLLLLGGGGLLALFPSRGACSSEGIS